MTLNSYIFTINFVDNQNLTKEELEQAKKLSKRLQSQNNRATEPLVFFELQDIEKIACNTDYDTPDYYYYSSDEWACDEPIGGETVEDIKSQIIKEAEEDGCPVLIQEAKELDLDYFSEGLSSWKYMYIVKGIFFTEESAKNHLESNKHHFTDKARIYVSGSYRNEEAKLVYKILTSIN